MAQVAVFGLGRFGFHVAKQLHLAGHDVLAVDIDENNVQKIEEHSSRAVVMDARDKERLAALGLHDFDTVVLSFGERIEASALVALYLKEIGVKRIVAKAGSEDHGKLLEVIGVHEIIFPEKQAAERLARRLTNTLMLDYIPLGDTHTIVEVAPSGEFVGKTLDELKLRNRYGVQVLAIRDVLTDGLVVNPDAQFRIKDSDILVVLGSNEDINRLRSS